MGSVNKKMKWKEEDMTTLKYGDFNCRDGERRQREKCSLGLLPAFLTLLPPLNLSLPGAGLHFPSPSLIPIYLSLSVCLSIQFCCLRYTGLLVSAHAGFLALSSNKWAYSNHHRWRIAKASGMIPCVLSCEAYSWLVLWMEAMIGPTHKSTSP